MVMHAQAKELSTVIAAENNQALGNFMRQQLGGYLSGSPHFSIQPLPIHVSSFRPGDQLQLIGDSMQASAAHITLIGGRLPQDSGDEVEIALTPGTADAIHATLGQEFTTTIGFFGSPAPISATLKLRLVGLFIPTPGDPFWHGETFGPAIEGEFTLYKTLMSNDGFLVALTLWCCERWAARPARSPEC